MQQYGQYPDPGAELASQGGLDGLWLVVLGALAVAVGVLFFIAVMRRLLYIARPNEALIFSGKRYTTPDGQVLGYKVVRQGRRAFKVPFLERIDRMDMTLIPVDIVTQNAYSKGNIPLQIHAIANVKIHSNEANIANAVERFLGKPTAEIQLVAQQTLEGALREVLAQMTPEEVNEDRLKFAQNLIDVAEDDLDKLGLQLDTLKIQSVSDETGYLDSLGRPIIATALRDAENAENAAMQEIAEAQATASQRAEVAKATADTGTQQKTNELRRVMAELDGAALSVEREAEAAAKTARAEAELELQKIRAQLEKLRLEAEVVIPADFNQRAASIAAIGAAAPTKENGAAAVAVLEMMSQAWKDMGPQAKEIYVIQHLEEIVGTVVRQLDHIEIDEVHVLDHGDGAGLSSYAATYPKMVSEVMKALKESTGVDVPGILSGSGNGATGAGPARAAMPQRGLSMGAFIAVAGIIVIFGVAIVLLIKNVLYVCKPNEVLVFSGRSRTVGDGKVLGYRIIKGGRTLRVPLLETVDQMDLTNMIIELTVHSAYSRGGIPLTVQGVANIKVPGEEPLIHASLERFLGKSRGEIMKVARETLEGNLRGVLAILTPEQVNQDKEAFAMKLTEEAEHDLTNIGLVLDTLKIQNVTDDVGYLDSIGRMRSADIRMRAQVAEATAKAEAAENKWRNTLGAEVAKLNAQIEVARKDNERRIADATTKRGAMIAEERAQVQANISQSTAEIRMQEARIEQVKSRLQADVIEPAEANRKRAEQGAKADAAQIIEQGRATAQVLSNLAATYRASGTNGRDVLLMQKLVPMLKSVTSTIGDLHVDKLTIIGGGNGANGGDLAGKLVKTNEQIKAATGMDIPAMLTSHFGGGATSAASPLDAE